ncbi:MAG TPA: LamG-like jellyroll fold domain-containing protein [Verrucomicrobiae bacterium]|nr:LamG-like jellyroll fold domain-containing protein [Verrucomicrobiae bacterium]
MNLRCFNSGRKLSIALLALIPAFSLHAQFIHPGGLHTQADFDRMKSKVAAGISPWIDSYRQLTNVAEANLGWPWAPVTQIVRGASPNNYARSQKDALAIYYLALRWRISGDTNYAEKAVQGCDAWSGTMTNGVGGNSNWALGAGICGYEFAVAGEVLHGYTNWSQTSVSNYCNFLKIFAAGNESFLVNHNGTCDSHYWCNWDACNLASLMACGVFCDDTNMFQTAVDYFEQGKGNGNITSAAWFIHTNGLAQWQESGRDQAHTMDGIAWMGVACQVAWNQSVDLYGYDNNRFLRALEYVAKYNLWNDVPYAPFDVCEGANFAWGTAALSSGSRGFLPPTWDMFYNHYVNVKGLSAPWTAQAAAALRPDGFYNNGNSPDFVGFTTLTCMQDSIADGAAPTGLTANVSETNVTLTWFGSAYATNYLVKRATVSGGPYTAIATISNPAEFVYTDTTATNGGTYYYVVSAVDKFGESANSAEKQVSILDQLTTYYKFDESSGTTAADSSGLSPSATLENGASFIAGKFGNALNLNGSSQYVALPNGLISGLHDFTIVTWVYLNSINTWARIFDFGADIDRYMFLTPFSGSGTTRFAISKFNGGGEQQINGPALSPSAWHQVAVTLKGTEGSGVGILYVDGVAVGTNSVMSYYPDMIGSLVNATNNFIGRSQFSGDPYLNGKIDDFRIYNGALSAAQIASLYTSAPPSAPSASTATATAVSSSVIHLSWTAIPGATSYLVRRSLTSGGAYDVVVSGITATNLIDTGLSGSTTYYYVVAGVNSGGAGTDSVEASATTLTPPATPTGLTATGIYGGQIILSWNASVGATGYDLKRSLNSGGPYVTVATGITSTGFTNSGLVFNATYYYVVSAVNANGESLESNEAGSIVPVPTLVWQGNMNSNWDGVTTNWLFGGIGGTYSDGSTVIFNDTATRTALNLPANVAPYSIVFSNSSLSYTINSTNSSGIGGEATLTKWGTGTVTLNTTNTFTGDTVIMAGTLSIGGAGELGGGNYSGNIANYGTFNYASSAAQRLDGNISLAGSLSKGGSGTLTLTKANDYTGATTVGGGVLLLMDFGQLLSSSSILVGNTAGNSGAFFQSGDNTVVNAVSGLNGLQIGSAADSFGYYNLSAGTINLATEMHVGGSSGGAGTFGQFDMNGGNVVMSDSASSFFIMNRGGAGESSVVNLSGGIVDVSGGGTPSVSGANGLSANWSGSGAAQTNTTTLSGDAQFLIPSLDVFLNVGGNAANICNLNLNGGVMQVLCIPSAAGASRINFNGGTLKAGNSGGLLIGSLQSVLIYSNGATIDDNGQTVAIDQPLLAPTGNGVSSIPIANGGAGYVMPPEILITGGGGSNATATAAISNGVVASVIVTCPGAGYTSAPTIRFAGGGFTTAATPGTATISPNIGGGLIKQGSGTLTLSGANNYSGPTVIAAGTLKLDDPLLHLSFDETNGATVINQGAGGAALNGTLTGTNVLIVSGGHSGKALMVSNGPASTGYVLVNSPVVNFNGQPGNNWTVAMWLKTSTPGGVYLYQGSGVWSSGNTEFYLENGTQGDGAGTHAGGVRYAQSFVSGTTNLADGNWHFVAMTVSNGVKNLFCDGAVDPVLSGSSSWTGSGTGNQLWIGGAASGADSKIGFNGLIDDVSVFGRALSRAEITNIMNGAKATSPALPANANVILGSGATLVLDTTAQSVGSLSGSNSSSILLGGNSSTAFTFGNSSSTVFAGSISGNGSVTKSGMGTVTLSGANNYSGATIINSGTVKFGQSNNTNYVASLGPLLWFNFDQGVGDGIVTNLGSGGAAMNGILNGNAVTTSSGKYGSALYLDGVSDLEVDNKVTPLDCDSFGASWTYALWIKTSTAGATYGYQGDGTWSSDATTFYLNNNGTSAGTKAGGVRWGDGWLTGTTALNDNSWHFVAITVSGGVKTIYVDGQVDAQTGATGWSAQAMTSADKFLIGDTPDTGDGEMPFIGSIDEIYMFNRALSQNEIQNIMSNETVVVYGATTGQLPPASPVSLASGAFLDLTGTSQTIASLSDVSGSGGILTNSGSSVTLTFNDGSADTFSGTISDTPGSAVSLIKNGAGTQTLNGANNYSGDTTVNAGTLTFGQPTLPTNGTVIVTNGAILNLNFTGTNRIGALILDGIGQPAGIYNSANSSAYLSGSGNLLIPDPVATNPTNISFTVSNGNFRLSWPLDHLGWRLQVQINSLNAGLGTNWVTVDNSTNINQLSVPMTTNSSVFYRLIYP